MLLVGGCQTNKNPLPTEAYEQSKAINRLELRLNKLERKLKRINKIKELKEHYRKMQKIAENQNLRNC